MASPLVKKLIQVPIFRGLKDTEVAQISEISEETAIQRGAQLFREGDEGDALYVVLEGELEITKRDKAGRQQFLAKVSGGSVLGEMSLVTGLSARSATAVATTDAKLLKIPANRFAKLLREDSVAALKIVANLAQVMSRRLKLMDEKVIELLERGSSPKKAELAEFQKILSDWSF